MNNLIHIQTNKTIKLRFPSPMTENYWTIEEPMLKTLYAVPFLAVMIAVGCANPIAKSNLFELILSKFNTSYENVEKTLTSLMSKQIIITVDEKEVCNALCNNFLKWVKSGWGDAANYHFFTWDAPFVDYTKIGEGFDIDRKIMKEYERLESDTERYKKYTVEKNIQLPSFDIISSNKFFKHYTIEERVKHILSIAFGKKGEKSCHWNDIPLIRRTSPSGGSRHCTEGYFLSINVKEIEHGFYHIQTEPPSLSLISSCSQFLLNEFVVEELLDFPIIGAIILTSFFERNMYRYREPRTFRTIHMDVGHILTTIETVAKEFHIKTQIHLSFDEKAILQCIGASNLEEGPMAILTLYEEENK